MPTLTEQFTAEHFTLNSITASRQEQVLLALSRLETFLGKKPLQEATDQDLRAWLVALLGSGLTASTVAFHLKAVMPFYRWAWLAREVSADDYMRLREVSPPRGYNTQMPRPYSRKELAQMWADLAARYPYTTDVIIGRWKRGTSPYRSVKKHAMRLQLEAIIELALVCGLRRVEIYNLSIDDCHWDNKYVVVRGKRVDQNDKLREVPYPESTRTAIRRWFRIRGLMAPIPGQGLWLSVTGPDPVSAMTFGRFERLLLGLGAWELHRLRHTCATERLRAGMTLEKLQRFLGHSNIQQTLRYADLVRGDIHKESEKIDADFQRAIRPKAA